jgi:hypothetical protein
MTRKQSLPQAVAHEAVAHEAVSHENGGRLAFAGPCRPILVSGADALLPHMARYLPEWPRGPASGAKGRPSDIRVSLAGGRLRIEEGNPLRAASDYASPLEAANGLSGALIAAYVEQDAALACLHAAAAETARGLLVLIGDTEAGKSSLAAQLTRAGLRSFGDDRLILRFAGENDDATGDIGIALGLPLKLRLPLPAEAEAELAPWVASRTAARSADLVQLRLAPGEAAGFGSEARLSAFVLLDRGPGRQERLEPVLPSALLQALLSQGFAPRLEPSRRVAVLGGLAMRLPGFRLSFARSDLAASLLAGRFAAAPASR